MLSANLRRMRVHLEQPKFADDLISYLDRCNCRVRRLAEDLVDVKPAQTIDVDAALRLTKAGRCYACGEPVEAALAELGSPLCHDCRRAPARNGRAESSRALLEVQAYLQVWNALHPSAATTLVD
jgi:hypothetical protein